jgi:biotin transport system permease protein
MLGYAPGDTLAHSLDARTKIGFQSAFAVAAFAHTTPRGLAGMTAVVAVVVVASATPTVAALRSYRGLLPFLLGGPLVAGAVLGPPWFDVDAATYSALASYRIVLVLLVGTAFVRTTPPRDSRAAIQWLVPGRAGVFLGTGVAFVLRFLPVLQSDLASIRDAMSARLGDERGIVERIKIVGTAGLRRLFTRSDQFALALQARCFSWNPTLPPLSFGRRDAVVVGLSAVLFAVGVVGYW